MKKICLLFGLSAFGLVFSQEKSEKLLSPKPKKEIFTHSDSATSLKLKRETASSPFYKNLDSNKAARYKMLTKKVPSNKHYQPEKPKPFSLDPIKPLKPLKPLSK